MTKPNANLKKSAKAMARMIGAGEISSEELVAEHLRRLEEVNPQLGAAVAVMEEQAMEAALAADRRLRAGEAGGRLHGVPFSVKDSIDVRGVRTTAGTKGRRAAEAAREDATLVRRLREAGGIPIAKTNLPDLLFSFETDNLIFGKTRNPYDLERTPGGSSGGESALIAGCGSPLGLGSDAFGSVRLPAAFCGITSLKPTSGRLPRTGHVPGAGGWLEAVWQIGPMARWTEDLVLAMELMTGEDGNDFRSPPVTLDAEKGGSAGVSGLRIAFYTDNGFRKPAGEVAAAVRRCVEVLERGGARVEERRAPGVESAYELEMSIAGADGCAGIEDYLDDVGSQEVHPLLEAFLDRMRRFEAASVGEFAKHWEQWDEYRAGMQRFWGEFDAVVCPVYTQTALRHGESVKTDNFEGFSYTMAWNMAGAPAATVRCGEAGGLPVNVQVAARPWRDMLTLKICEEIEREWGWSEA